jgi:hypothetical protein
MIRMAFKTTIAIGFLLGFSAAKVAAVEYVAVDLNARASGHCQLSVSGVSNGQQVGYGYLDGSWPDSPVFHAVLWNGSDGSATDLNPNGFVWSTATATNGSQQIGWGWTGSQSHALLWSGTADSAIDLNPAGYFTSTACGVNGSQQVGYGMYDMAWSDQALLWNGSAESVVVLHAPGYTYGAAANGINDTGQVVGVGYLPDYSGPPNVIMSKSHALLWRSSTYNDFVDLNPSGFFASSANAIFGNQQVGTGTRTDKTIHAFLWSGTAGSAIDLNPRGFSESRANSLNDTQQVGYGKLSTTDDNSHALLWSGTADSAIDLHQLLPSDFTQSRAYGIDAQGNIVGDAMDSLGNRHAILWQVVPEPSTVVLLGMSVIGILVCGWRRRNKGK